MDRREVLRLLGSAAAISAFPLEALAVIQDASAQVAQSTGLRTLNAAQNATVTTIAEMIIPATDTPGAQAAKVNEFIDLLLTEWFEPAETRQFLAGLADVDARSKKKFSAAFVACTPAQQTEILTELDAEAMEFAARQKKAMLTPATQPQVNASLQQTHAVKQTSAPPPMNFFYQMKKLTLAGYYTTDIGFTQELDRDIVPLKHAGCAPLAEVAR
ncbi:Gluconate 2-dehydrogenase subunit 3 [Granulicella pectinivorans]|uniref:Gluconate 2-dehydrogenase subunit 3 n=1 Tax=Granulicella pectinivorans TaxID=474950 RepID=A0A1I6LCS7_9BACT|nr:gluconate 2-dehydrogenase subunit 3 family protein [Granulicella pectinivorans]SFS01281.1 Gluconate 2-dehydrogenase subunit 3 [Granulicella pectinivorans]